MGGGGSESAASEQISGNLPFEATEFMVILGDTFKTGLNFPKQLPGISDRAKIRLAVLARVSASTLGLGTTISRLTHDAPPANLVRHALFPIGSSTPERRLQAMVTGATNIAAHRISGVGRSASILLLRAPVGVLSPRNLHILECAEGLDRALGAYSSP